MMDLLFGYWGAQFCTINKALFCFFPGWYLSTSCAIVRELFVFTNSRFKTEPIHLILPGYPNKLYVSLVLNFLSPISAHEKHLYSKKHALCKKTQGTSFLLKHGGLVVAVALSRLWFAEVIR